MLVKRQIKSWFILPALVLSAVLCVLSLLLALRGDFDRLAWWGALLAAVPLPLLIMRLRILKPPRTSENEPLALLVSAVGTFIAAWEFLFEGSSGWQPLAAAMTGSSLLLLYIFWYSRFGRIASGKLDVRNKLPDFALEDIDGNAVSSGDLLGAPAVLLFYRGNWCTLCVAQLRELAARRQAFEQLGARIVLISPQPPENSRELAESLAAGFDFWFDRESRVARGLDIAASRGVPLGTTGYHPDTVMPTVVVTNENGTILFSDQTNNHRVRPEPDLFLAILRRAGTIVR